MIDWNDEGVREAARWMVDASNEILGAAKAFAPGHESEYLEAMADAMICDHLGCDCGGALGEHWPQAFPNQCDYHRHCPCGGNYHKGLKLNYG